MFAPRLAAIAGIFMLLAASCLPNAGGQSSPVIRVGSTNFSEQLVVAELYSQALEAAGYRVERRFNMGSRETVAPALEAGQIDLYPEYLATYVIYLTKDPSRATSNATTTFLTLVETLQSRGITPLFFASAIDSNGLAVGKAFSDRNGVTKISDLAKLNGQLVLGGPPECVDRPLCLPGLEKTYGLKFKEFRGLDASGPITADALKTGQIDVAVLFTTSALIAGNGFVALEDDKKLQPADNLVPIIRNDMLSKAPNQDSLKKAINDVSAKLTTSELAELNRQIDLERKEPKDIASAWLRGKGLIK